VLSRLYGHHVDVIDVHGRVLIVAGAGDDADLRGCEETVEHEIPGELPREPDEVAP
jgi:hypothetical protein